VDTGTATDDNEKNKSKIVNKYDEEPRSKIVTDASPSDGTSSPTSRLWDLPADFDVYCINKFDSVTIGKEAGWPGQWEEVVEEEMMEEQLLYSLQMKGSAMSNEAWQEHWGRVGPSLLAQGWLERYPSVSLVQVEQVTGVGFLNQAVQSSKLTNAVEKLSLNSAPNEDTKSKEEACETLDPPDMSGLSIDDTATKVDDQNDQNASKLMTADGIVADESQPQLEQKSFSDEQITEMWLNFYNEYYWYCYQQFVGPMDETSKQSSVNLIEDYVVAKKCYEHTDSLVMAEDNDIIPADDNADKNVTVAPDSGAVEPNPTVVCTDNANSELVDKTVATKDESLDVSTPLNTILSCPDSQDGKKEISNSQQCEDQAKNLNSQKHSKDKPPDFQEHPHEDEKSSKSEHSEEGKEDQSSQAGVSKKTEKVGTKHIWQMSKSAQYTSIVWALQEAGIIPSDELSLKLVNDQAPCYDQAPSNNQAPSNDQAPSNNQAPCNDQIHCNGTTPDKEADSSGVDDTTSGAPQGTTKDSYDTIPPIPGDHNQLTKESLKRKR